jgi:N-sulfoglucosamine sulfohydrolase
VTSHSARGAAASGLVLALAASAASAAVQPGSPEQPNILWLTTEDMSPALGAFGDAYARTPNLDRLARDGIRYTAAYVSAPICSPSRSALITGVYASSLGTQHLRSSIRIPASIRTLPEYLREWAYFTSNNAKTDYNFDPSGRWDESGDTAHWRHRRPGQPFFSVFNFMTTHEGPTNDRDEKVLEGLADRHDPARAVLPPYFPDTPEMRRIWARDYDLVSQMDRQVGDVLKQLEDDGLLANTIVFFFSDHGHGLPRYKRWLYRTGLQVPLIVRVPARYQHLAAEKAGRASDRLVSLVDVAPTVLSLCGVRVPGHMEGRPFLGPQASTPRAFVVGARDRADDVYDLARSLTEDRYEYVRHYLPHRPYIQRAEIFSDRKASYRELNRLHAQGALPAAAAAMYLPRPREELFDLQADPAELHNLAGSASHAAALGRMRERLRQWILETRDTAFLPEPELMARSEGTTPYEMAHRSDRYDLPRILAAAERVGDASIRIPTLAAGLEDADSAVRYWSVMALQARGPEAAAARDALARRLGDSSSAVALEAASTVCQLGDCAAAYPELTRYLRSEDRPWETLLAAAVIRDLGERARPLLAEIQAARKRHGGTADGRYRDWMFSMFVGFALDQALANLEPAGESSVPSPE